MEKSKLETISEIKLFYLLKGIKKDYVGDIDYETIEDNDFLNICDVWSKMLSLGDLDFVDYNFIIETFTINPDYDFLTKKLVNSIKIPVASEYSFDVDEFRTNRVKYTYQHTIVSYNENLVQYTIRGMENNSSFDYWDGKLIDEDIYDTDTNDVEIDMQSITKIK